MAISREIQDLLSKGKFDGIEDHWLATLDRDPHDLAFFIGVARALVGHGRDERAKTLLEMLDEQLKERGSWSVRLPLLRETGPILFRGGEGLHPAIVETVREVHAAATALDGLIEVTGLLKAPGDTAKTWDKVDRLATLASFDVGTIVWMEGKGVGTVAEVNVALQAFRVDFETIKRLSVGFKAAPKLMKALEPDHILRRKVEDPESIKALAANDPSEMLRLILQSHDRPLTAAEVKQNVAGVVTPTKWASWWAAARKHPQVVVGAKGRQSYTWAESSDDAFEAAWKTFERATPRKKLDALRRDGSRDQALAERMAESLEDLAEVSAESEPGLTLEIYFALEKANLTPSDVDWAPEALVSSTSDPADIALGVQDRVLRERVFTLIRERRDDWLGAYRVALSREEDARVLTQLADAVAGEDAETFERFLDDVIAQPHKMPAAFTWLAERAADDESLRQRNPLRLLQQILSALNRNEFAPYRLRLQPMAESGGTLPRLLGNLSADQATQAADALHRAPGLEGYQRDDLRAALELRFPELRQAEDEGLGTLYALPASIDAKRAELKDLLENEIPTNRVAIEEARALGDLRENFEYHSARARHEFLNARAAELNSELSRVRPLEAGTIDTSEVRVGTKLDLKVDGEAQTLTILGPWESDPDRQIVSYESALAKALLGKGVGDTATVGEASYAIQGIAEFDS